MYGWAGQATDDSIACWIPKATNKHSEYVIVLVVPLQQWLHERASVLLYIQITPLVTNFQRVQIGEGKQQWRQETFGLERLLHF
jgi:hypothetical protein